MPPRPRLLPILAVLLGCLVVGFLAARHRRPRAGLRPGLPGAVEVSVPHAQGAITLDGDTDDPGWRGVSLRTGPFVGKNGLAVHPDSEARIVWGDGFLYLNLYAADEDIRVSGKAPDSLSPDEDSFHLVFTDGKTEWILDVNALGVVSDAVRPRGSTEAPDRSWESHVHVSHELDGTPNNSKDNDEEWVLEVAIPFESIALRGQAGEKIALAMSRCDTPHHSTRICSAWGEPERPKVLVLAPP